MRSTAYVHAALDARFKLNTSPHEQDRPGRLVWQVYDCDDGSESTLTWEGKEEDTDAIAKRVDAVFELDMPILQAMARDLRRFASEMNDALVKNENEQAIKTMQAKLLELAEAVDRAGAAK